ncbi:LysR family transcriptional regulator [Enemella dayhoffiae]|uniref:LysR family transcriptional regulator n=1 Tax=Enemella dayhoffiae TaxID=2016507 RepID=A0A255H3Z2_9ACTN|nr:LysR substrate-binding domain-containing protein [Enemella dayhoffiae]OYO22411.1 LysR family transcriptional regulator [Enemella dayhoffiae]
MSDSAAQAVLRVGHVPGVTLTKWRTRWAERLTERLDVVELEQAKVRHALDEGEVDMCCVRLPIDTDGLHAIPLYEEVMVAWVSKEHPIAAFDTITLADLADETVLSEPDQVAIDRVNAGAVLLAPMSVARSASRRDLVHRPVVDAPPVPMVLAWPTDKDNPLISEFIGIVRGRTANSSRTDQERASRTAAVGQDRARRGGERSRRRSRRR